MPLELTHPWCLLGLIGLPIIAWYSIWSLSDFPIRQRLISALVRSAILVLLVFSCAGLTVSENRAIETFHYRINQCSSRLFIDIFLFGAKFHKIE